MEHSGGGLRAEDLLAGPHGRRMLLAHVTDRLDPADAETQPPSAALYHLARRLDPDPGITIALFESEWETDGTPELPPPADDPLTLDEGVASAAALLAVVPVSAPEPGALADALETAVSTARYWQKPDGAQTLASLPELRDALVPVAERIASSPHAAWWATPVVERAQWSITWEEVPSAVSGRGIRDALRAAHEAVLAQEARAAAERPRDPEASVSGEWWSRPPIGIPASARAIGDGAPPVGLDLVEDGFGWEYGDAVRVRVPPGLRVWEIDSAESWAELCRRFPIEVTAQRRHDWYRTTGRDGRWVEPDWVRVAEEYDGVHLQVRGYLRAAGAAIPVGHGTASVIAGWDPDATFWCTDMIRFVGEPVRWRRRETSTGHEWIAEQAGEPNGAS